MGKFGGNGEICSWVLSSLLSRALLSLPRLYEWLCSSIQAKCSCPGKKKKACLSCPTAGMNLVLLQAVDALCSHGFLCSLCISDDTTECVRWWTGRGKCHLHKKVHCWYIFGVGIVFFLYVHWQLKFQNMTEQKGWLHKTETLLSFMEQIFSGGKKKKKVTSSSVLWVPAIVSRCLEGQLISCSSLVPFFSLTPILVPGPSHMKFCIWIKA